MPFCSKCGTQLEQDARFCPICGQPTGAEQKSAFQGNTAQGSGFQKAVNDLGNAPDHTGELDPADIAAHKSYAIFSYLSWLVLVPLLGAPKSKFARFHANQGLILAIVETIWYVASGILKGILRFVISHLSAVPWILYNIVSLVFSLIGVFLLVLAILGIVNVVNGKAKELPIVGKLKILKD